MNSALLPSSAAPQERQMAGLLLGHDDIAIGQHEQAARMLELRKQRGAKSLRHLRRLTVEGDGERAIADGLGGFGLRQLVRADPERLANLLVLGNDARARRDLVFGAALSLRAQRQCCEADAANRNDCDGDAGRHYTLSVVARRPPVSSALGNNPARDAPLAAAVLWLICVIVAAFVDDKRATADDLPASGAAQ